MEVVRIISNLPRKFAELSYKDEDAAIRLMRAWGEGKKDVEALWEEIHEILDVNTGE